MPLCVNERSDGGESMVRMDEIDVVGCPGTRRAWLQRAMAGLVACLASGAWALEGGSGPQDPLSGAPWSAVGSLAAGQRLLSAVAIAPSWVLTAAHAVNGAQSADVVFRTPLGGGFSSRARTVHVHPAFISGKVDLALVELEQRVPPGMAIAQVFTGALPGRLIQLVSHGGSTTLITRGENRIDAVQPGALGEPLLYLFDYDTEPTSPPAEEGAAATAGLGPGREATLVSGDSGSAAFVVIDGRWGLAGINTFQATVTPREGGVSTRLAGGIVLASQTAWIARAMRGEPSPQPAPRPGPTAGHTATP